MVGRRLGRGLEFLLSDRATQDAGGGERSKDEAPAGAPAPAPEATAGTIALDRIEPNPFQPRKTFDATEITRLARSIRENGVLQPLLVRPHGDRYQIIAGERRARAAREAGLSEVPAVVRGASDIDMRLLALVENLQRADLDPIEKAVSFRDLKQGTGWTHERLAKAVGLDRSSVSNYLRLLELEPAVRREIRAGKLSMGHARALLQAPETHRTSLAEQVVASGLSVRETERLASAARRETKADPSEERPQPRKPAWAIEMEENLIAALGCRTRVSFRNGRGRIVLEVGGREEFDRVFETLMSAAGGESDAEILKRKAGRGDLET